MSSGTASITDRDFRDDNELGLGVAGLNLASSGDMVIDVVAFVDIAYDTDPWFVLEEPIDESIQIGVPESLSSIPTGIFRS